jgi:hypothetical protein
MAMLVLCGACGGTEGTGDTEGTTTPASQAVRDARYCEILGGYLEGTGVRIDVYNTYGLNDCPEATWGSIDTAAVQKQLGAASVTLNGPRHWLMDSFTKSEFVDPTPVTLGGLEMRKAGVVNLTLAEAMGMQAPYVTRSVKRTTTWVYDAGKMVYELLDPTGQVFVMQSYSLQKDATLTQADLAKLGERLTLPAGWTYKAEKLAAELHVTAVGGVATVVQDELANTYQLSQQ